MNENPYAAPPTLPIATNEQASEEYDPRLLVPSLSLITISAVLVSVVTVVSTLETGGYLLGYFAQWKTAGAYFTPETSFYMLQWLMATGVAIYGTARLWYYRWLINRLLAGSIGWTSFARGHTSFWRATLIQSALTLIIYMGNSVVQRYISMGM
ncbi:MAG TPA: hypothetical protein VL096_08150 [Pirellulaceae bacterium]|nr:hypothetical protein [Pirellulaceae bacterium]